MKKYNGYEGYYKGYEDSYLQITMSPWIEDVLEEMDKIKTNEAKEIKEKLIKAAYYQKDDLNEIVKTLSEFCRSTKDNEIYEILTNAFRKELKFLVAANAKK